MDKFQDDQLVIIFINNSDEVQTRITLINDLIVFVVEKIAHFGFASNHQLINLHSLLFYLFQEPLLLHLWHIRRVPLGESRSSVSTNQKETVNHLQTILYLIQNNPINPYFISLIIEKKTFIINRNLIEELTIALEPLPSVFSEICDGY